jgi:asparagine synthase (glutamine-hydrolysing)
VRDVRRSPDSADAMLVLANVLWSLNYATTKYAFGAWLPLAFASTRFVVAGTLFAAVVWRLEGSLRVRRSDVPLGVWLSGGVDSSTVLHYAAERTARQLKTFSVSFAGRRFDESRYFREVARVYGTDHYELDLSPEATDLGSAIEEFAYYSDEPSADAGALPVWFLSRMSRKHVTVALSGEGADEMFGGYLTYLADGLARPLRLTPEPLRRVMLGALERYVPVSDEKIGLEYKL